jgi:hypothetical protein
MPNGKYMLADDDDPAHDINGHPGMERGTYTWDPLTGAFSATALVNTDGAWGFSHPDGGTWAGFVVQVTGNRLEASRDSHATFRIDRVVPVPEPRTYAMMIVGLSLLALRLRRKAARER